MSTTLELELRIAQLEKELLDSQQKTQLLLSVAKKAVDYAMHNYRVDHYGFIWVWNQETKVYQKTEMRICSPKLQRHSVTTEKLADGAVTPDKLAPGAITADKLAPGIIDPSNIVPINALGAVMEEELEEELQSYAKKTELPVIPSFKTINGQSITGSGNIAISATGVPIDLSPYALKEEIPDISGLASKSEIPDISGLASKSEIPTVPTFKTINGESITGEGNIVISGGSSGGTTPDLSAYALKSEIPDISGLASKSEIPDISGLASKSEIPDISGLASKSEIPTVPTFKTINGEPITGEGNIVISGGGSGTVDLSDYALKSEIPTAITVDSEVTANSENPVKSSGVSSFVTSTVNGKFVVLTEAQYNAMESHDADTFYFIKQ